MGSAAQGGNVRTRLPGRGITSSAARASASANDVCRKDRGDGLTVDRRLESPAKKMALVAGVFIVAPDVRISILAMGSPMRPYTLTQTDQSFSKSYLQAGRAIRFCGMRSPGRAGTAISCKGLPSINPVFQHEHRAPRRGRISRMTPVNILGAYRVILSPDIGQCLTLILAWVANVG